MTSGYADNVIIRARGVYRDFMMGEQRSTVLDGIDLDVQSGQFCSIMGPSGSGKSTLMHCLSGLDRPSGGTVQVAGWQLDTLSRDELAMFRQTTIGFIFQQYHLVPTMTALENVSLPGVFAGLSAGARYARAESLLNKVGMADRLHYLPRQLSGGQQQRVAIARALFNNPPIIMGDEPTGALDSKTGTRVMQLLRTLTEKLGRTVIVVTHDPSVAAYADRVIHLSDGIIVDDRIQRHGQE